MTDMDILAQIKAERLMESMRKKRKKTYDGEDCLPCTAASPNDVPIHGLAALYDTWTSDGGEIRRRIEAGALFWDLEEEGIPIVVEHDGGVKSVVGRIDEASNVDTGMEVSGRLFAPEPADQEEFDRLVNLISENSLGWSIRMSEEEGTVKYLAPKQEPQEGADGSLEVPIEIMMELSISKARVRHLAIVDTPAFPGARPELGEVPIAAAATLAIEFSAVHFERWPDSKDPVPLRVEKDGRVWGHAAGDGCFRTGAKAGVCSKYSPDPDKEMRNFHTGTILLDNGSHIRVGSLTCANLHASINLTHEQQRHYHENSSLVWAKVVAWNDSRGRLCISGSVVKDLDESVLKQVAGLPLSVELWPVPGVSGLTLVGAHTVVAPAWPVH